MKIKIGCFLLSALLATVFFGLRQQTLHELRSDNESLRREIAARSTRPAEVAPLQPTPAPADLTEAEHRELLQLRGRIGFLREEARDLSNRVATLTRKPVSPSGDANGIAANSSAFKVREAADVGQATPQAMVQSYIRAINHGDTNRLLQLYAVDTNNLTPSLQQSLAQLSHTSGLPRSEALVEMRFLEEQPADNGDRWICYEARNPGGGVKGRLAFLARPTDQRWLLVVDDSGWPMKRPMNP
jgi:hypothetical protein